MDDLHYGVESATPHKTGTHFFFMERMDFLAFMAFIAFIRRIFIGAASSAGAFFMDLMAWDTC